MRLDAKTASYVRFELKKVTPQMTKARNMSAAGKILIVKANELKMPLTRGF